MVKALKLSRKEIAALEEGNGKRNGKRHGKRDGSQSPGLPVSALYWFTAGEHRIVGGDNIQVTRREVYGVPTSFLGYTKNHTQ